MKHLGLLMSSGIGGFNISHTFHSADGGGQLVSGGHKLWYVGSLGSSPQITCMLEPDIEAKYCVKHLGVIQERSSQSV
jgi:hypothetical protein